MSDERHQTQTQLTDLGHRALNTGKAAMGMSSGEYIEWLIKTADPKAWRRAVAAMKGGR
jgi:hypothetical protein